MTLKPVVLWVPITELPTLVERESKQTALNDRPKLMSLPIYDLSYQGQHPLRGLFSISFNYLPCVLSRSFFHGTEDNVKEEFDEQDCNELFSDNQFDFLKAESCDINDDETLEDSIKINPDIHDFYDELGNNESEEKYQETELTNCSKCGETFSNLSELVEHFNEKHKPTNGQYVCPLCPKEEFENLENLNKHINKIHLKSEKKQGKKKKHRKTRTSKSVQCDYCQVFFHQKGNLKKHIDKYHPEEENQCNDAF